MDRIIQTASKPANRKVTKLPAMRHGVCHSGVAIGSPGEPSMTWKGNPYRKTLSDRSPTTIPVKLSVGITQYHWPKVIRAAPMRVRMIRVRGFIRVLQPEFY